MEFLPTDEEKESIEEENTEYHQIFNNNLQPEDQSIEHESDSGDEKAPQNMQNRTGDEYEVAQQGRDNENNTSKKIQQQVA